MDLGYDDLDGVLWPRFFPKENFQRMRQLELRRGDIIQSTYPKCGTHWISYIIYSILHPEKDCPTGKQVQESIPLVDANGFASWDQTPVGSTRVLASHILASKLPWSTDAKYIVTVRNPFDCYVSNLYFRKSGFSIDTENFFEDFFSGDLYFGDYFDWLKQWQERRQESNVLFLTYESLKSDPRNGILRIARFLGLHEQLEEDGGKILDKIVCQTSFSSMKSNVKYTDKGGNEYPLLRKGIVGDFQESMSREQRERLRHKMEEKLVGTDLLREWTEAFNFQPDTSQSFLVQGNTTGTND